MSDSEELNRLREEVGKLRDISDGCKHLVGIRPIEIQNAITYRIDKIAKLEAEAEADPWREAKDVIYKTTWTSSPALQKVLDYAKHLTAENARLTARVGELEEINARLAKASEIYRDASWQSHNGHWDDTRQGGKGCLECVRANNLRDEVDKILKGGE